MTQEELEIAREFPKNRNLAVLLLFAELHARHRLIVDMIEEFNEIRNELELIGYGCGNDGPGIPLLDLVADRRKFLTDEEYRQRLDAVMDAGPVTIGTDELGRVRAIELPRRSREPRCRPSENA